MFDSCLSEFGCRRRQGKIQRPVKNSSLSGFFEDFARFPANPLLGEMLIAAWPSPTDYHLALKSWPIAIVAGAIYFVRVHGFW